VEYGLMMKPTRADISILHGVKIDDTHRHLAGSFHLERQNPQQQQQHSYLQHHNIFPSTTRTLYIIINCRLPTLVRLDTQSKQKSWHDDDDDFPSSPSCSSHFFTDDDCINYYVISLSDSSFA
jgi:hypothetical protein